jgi:hypothetical protein
MNQPKQQLFAALASALLFSACTKVRETGNHPTISTTTNSGRDDLVPTPAGMIPRSNVHLIGRGYKLVRQGNHFMKVAAQSGNVVQDFGEIAPKRIPRFGPRSAAAGSAVSQLASPNPNDSWVVYGEWENTSSTPITSFVTDWAVPSQPATTEDGQLIYIFNGLCNADSTEIIQPVLQWGNGPAGGSTYWSIANWYVVGNTAWISDIVTNLSPGTGLEGILTLYSQNADKSFGYTSSFAGYSNSLSIDEGLYSPQGSTSQMPALPFQALADVTLETYGPGGDGVPYATDYPAGQNYVSMNQIAVYLNGTFTAADWSPLSGNTEYGETAQVYGEDSRGDGNALNYGNVFLYFHPIPLINSVRFQSLTTTSLSYTITGYPGGLVTTALTGASSIKIGHGTATAWLTITTPGVTFTNGSTTVSSTNATTDYSFYMPASGSITVTGYYTWTVTSQLKSAYVQIF